MTIDVADQDHIADFDDFFRPLRNFVYWEPHCYDILFAGRSDRCSTAWTTSLMTDDIQAMMPDMERLDVLMPQMLTMMPEMIATMKSMKT